MRHLMVQLSCVVIVAFAAALLVTRGIAARALSHRGPEVAVAPVPAESPNEPTAVVEFPMLPSAAPVTAVVSHVAEPPRPREDTPAQRVTRASDGVHVDLRGVHDLTSLMRGLEFVVVDPSEGGGYRVRSLDGGGALQAGGVRVGDVMVAVNGIATLDGDGLLQASMVARGASVVSLRFRRSGGEFEVRAELER